MGQPQNTTVCAGDQARMDCAYMGTASSPYWRINSTVYPSFDLPPNHRFDGRSLIVTNVFLEYNDTTYQCFFEILTNDSTICQVASASGKLIVQLPTNGKIKSTRKMTYEADILYD